MNKKLLALVIAVAMTPMTQNVFAEKQSGWNKAGCWFGITKHVEYKANDKGEAVLPWGNILGRTVPIFSITVGTGILIYKASKDSADTWTKIKKYFSKEIGSLAKEDPVVFGAITALVLGGVVWGAYELYNLIWGGKSAPETAYDALYSKIDAYYKAEEEYNTEYAKLSDADKKKKDKVEPLMQKYNTALNGAKTAITDYKKAKAFKGKDDAETNKNALKFMNEKMKDKKIKINKKDESFNENLLNGFDAKQEKKFKK